MKKLILLIPIIIILLTRSSPSNSCDNYEWKAIYLDLLKKTITGEIEPRGIPMYHKITLLDFGGDGIPELEEEYTRANNPEYNIIWFIEKGTAKPLTGSHKLWGIENHTINFQGLWKNNETGELVLTDSVNYYSKWGYWDLYLYGQDNANSWKLQKMISWNNGMSNPDKFNDNASYVATYDGVNTYIKNSEAQQIINSFYESHTRIEGKSLIIQDLYPWTENSEKVIMEFFDGMDI